MQWSVIKLREGNLKGADQFSTAANWQSISVVCPARVLAMIRVSPSGLRAIADDLTSAAPRVTEIGDELPANMERGRPRTADTEPSCFQDSRQCEQRFAVLCGDYADAVRSLAEDLRTVADDYERLDATMEAKLRGHQP